MNLEKLNTPFTYYAASIVIIFSILVGVYLYKSSNKESYKNYIRTVPASNISKKIIKDSIAKGGHVDLNRSTGREKLETLVNFAESKPFSTLNPFNRGIVTVTKGNSTFMPAMGTTPMLASDNLKRRSVKEMQFPSSLDKWRKFLPDCRNQQNCGSCWAFATTELLAYRISCLTKGEWKKAALARGDKHGGWLSVQYIISCVRDENERGCQGAGILEEVIRHLTEGHRDGKGLYFNSEYPYEEDKNGEDSEGAPCKVISRITPRFNFESYYSVSNGQASKDEKGLEENIGRIKKELMDYGPVMTSMYVYDSFMSIDPDNNTPETPYSTELMGKGKLIGGHAVMMVGWGTIPGKDPKSYKNQYWIMRNSWGPQWNRDGYWYWRMGDSLESFQNGEDIMIEYMAVAGDPDMNVPYIKQIMGEQSGSSISSMILDMGSSKIWLAVGLGLIFIICLSVYIYYAHKYKK